MSDHNDISKEVQPLGPMWIRLPLEIVLEIVIYTMMAQRIYNNGKVIDKDRYDFINNFRPFKEYRRLTWPWPRSTFMKAFYSGNDFVFKVNCPFTRLSVPPALPPVVCRRFLRRIQIHIGLKDHYDIIMPGDYRATKIIRSVADLFKYSSGARILRDLTSTSGFGNLEVLDLHILSHFAHGHEAALALVEKAGFVVRARNVSITEGFWDILGRPGAAKRIGVELVE
jgi:hypothetical protein